MSGGLLLRQTLLSFGILVSWTNADRGLQVEIRRTVIALLKACLTVMCTGLSWISKDHLVT